MKTHRKFAAFIAAVAASTIPAMGLTWNDAGTTNNWSTAGGDTNWTGGVTWTNASAADFSASGTDTVTLTTAAMTAGTVTFGASSAYTIDTGVNNMTWSALAGSGGFTKSGIGTITIGGAGGASGTVKVSGGTVETTTTTALNTSGVTLDGGILKTSVDLANAIQLNNVAGNTISPNGAYRTLSGQITGSGGLIIGNGGGTPGLTLSNTSNNFTGNVTTNAGVYLQLTVSEVIPDTAVVIANGAAFKVNNTTETIAGLQGSAYLYSETGSRLVINSPAATSNTFSGSISAFGGATALAITKKGDGTQILSGASVHSGGTILSGGTLIANNSNALGTSGTVTINDASTGSSNTSLLLGQNVNVGRAITVANQGSGTVTLGANTGVAFMTFSGAIALNKDVTLDGADNSDRLNFIGGISGTGNVTIAGGTGAGRVQFYSTANTFSGNLGINAGAKLQIGDTTSSATSFIPDASVVTVGAGGFLKLTKGNNSETIGGLAGSGTVRGHEGVGSVASALDINIASGSQDFSGVLENGGAAGATLALTKSGAGTQTLSGANTYTGATAINGGTLAVNGTLGNTSTTVGNTGTLQGSGGTVGSVTVLSGGKLAPGNSIESLGMGNLSLATGSTYAYELQTNLYAGTPAAAGDLAYSSGTLSIAGVTTLTLTDLATSTVLANGSKLTLISYVGGGPGLGWNGGLFSYDPEGPTALVDLLDDSTFTLGANQWLFNYNDTVSGGLGVNYTGNQAGATSFVTMTVVPEPNAAMLVGGLGMLALLRRRRN